MVATDCLEHAHIKVRIEPAPKQQLQHGKIKQR